VFYAASGFFKCPEIFGVYAMGKLKLGTYILFKHDLKQSSINHSHAPGVDVKLLSEQDFSSSLRLSRS
jgi:hypothetical protein